MCVQISKSQQQVTSTQKKKERISVRTIHICSQQQQEKKGKKKRRRGGIEGSKRRHRMRNNMYFLPLVLYYIRFLCLLFLYVHTDTEKKKEIGK